MIYILLPSYNEGASIGTLLNRISTGMKNRGFSYKIIVYNDGSTDNTIDILRQNEYKIPLKILGKEQNMGLGVAMLALIKEVITSSENNVEDIVIVFDSDNTHNPEHIYHMVNRIKDGFDVVIASRYLRNSRVVGVTRFRQFLSMCASLTMRVLFPIEGVKDYTCGYRGYSMTCLKGVYEKFGEQLIEERGFACMAELLIKLRSIGILAVEIPIVLRYDFKKGESKMKIKETIKKTLHMILRLYTIRHNA
ncbi:MAG: glycosyltransferase family 2 protein [Candidatus Magnetobacterium sp. LHC-1]|uniref:Glycosyltransferase family 2 protein n=1 Tax=Candidatus Magnetobacterium casense TaxID=1455061 RepID=A0ABS6RVI0_9BACT|nr:glycosyltransferase family 2 protein [Candidatus Magnetobacterium casensis]MBF0606059.1 glycosyltransferase family 2 protein [Nitrospirota bacterium]MBV6340636.1 glycosyltransferase family 2 protein [Candidatus Magnetobacterium casensis]